MTARGKFITLEGPEGAGKSTQAKLLADVLKARGINCILTREPGGTPLAEDLRALVKHFKSDTEEITPETELFLMNAARAQHVQYKILPALEAGNWVICDRFSDSTLAYQGFARGMDIAGIKSVIRIAAGSCPIDRTLLFDLPPEAGFRRAERRVSTAGNYDRFEVAGNEFHRKVRAGFLTLAQEEPERFRVIRADRAIHEVHADVLEAVNDLF